MGEEVIPMAPPEEPWWWPLGPAAMVVGVLAVTSWLSWTWPIEDVPLAALRRGLWSLLALSAVAWVALGWVLFQRRRNLLARGIRVQVKDGWLAVGTHTLELARLQSVTWSPFGLLAIREDGSRLQVHARIPDGQVQRLQRLCSPEPEANVP